MDPTAAASRGGGPANRLAQPAIVGGLVTGALSALPLINAGNACCCLWIVGGGLVAAYLLQQNQAEPISTGDGALVGLLAGLAGSVVYAVISLPVTILIGPLERRLVERLIDMSGSIPRDTSMFTPGPIGVALAFVFSVVFFVMLAAIFSTLGGILGAAMFRKAPLAPPSGPPPADVPGLS